MDLLNQLGVLQYINVYLIMTLVAIGFLIKHAVAFINIDNRYIPLILFVVAMLYELAMAPSYSLSSLMSCIIDGIISSAIAVGFHNSGKQLLKPFIRNLFSSSSTDCDDTTEYSSEEDEYDEEESADIEEDEEEDSTTSKKKSSKKKSKSDDEE